MVVWSDWISSPLPESVPDHDRTDPFNLGSGRSARTAAALLHQVLIPDLLGGGEGGRLPLLGVRSESEQEVVMLAGAKLHICD